MCVVVVVCCGWRREVVVVVLLWRGRCVSLALRVVVVVVIEKDVILTIRSMSLIQGVIFLLRGISFAISEKLCCVGKNPNCIFWCCGCCVLFQKKVFLFVLLGKKCQHSACCCW